MTGWIWGILGIVVIAALIWLVITSIRFGKAVKEIEAYEAEDDARERARVIIDNARNDWLRHRNKG